MTEKEQLLDRIKKGPVAVIECYEEIPCDPCRTSCPKKAITFNGPIYSLPCIHLEKCTGCGLCVAICPGQAIFVIDGSFSSNEGLVSIPYEFLPLPEEGDIVDLTDRSGTVISMGKIHKVRTGKAFDHTAVVTLRVPEKLLMEVRGFKPKEKTEAMGDDVVVCRCEEITLGEIRQAILDGASTVDGVKRATRAGKGLCQGRTCRYIIENIIAREIKKPVGEIGYPSVRPPARVVDIKALASIGEDEQYE